MAVSGDYPKPVIGPEHPLSSPYGISAGSDPTISPAKKVETENQNLFRPDGMWRLLDISV
jgi:hypothetical protein